MNHSQLKAFHAVATEGSFTKAAERLRVSQPTLSGHVKALEESYGVSLFDRSGRNVAITEFGRSLLEITGRYFATEREAEQALAAAKGLLRGKLRVAADSPFFVVPVLAAFSRRYPSVTKTLSFGNSREVLAELRARRCDVAIIARHPDDEKILVQPVQRDRLVVIVNAGHVWARQRSIRMEELSGQTMLLRESGSSTRAVLEQALDERNITLGETMELGSREAIREGVAEGLGIGVISEGELGHDERLHTLNVRDAALNVVEYAACLHKQKTAPEVSAFLEMLGEAGG